MTYTPGRVPDPDVQVELEQVALELERPEPAYVTLTQWNAAPAKPVDGMIAYADGTNWDPGSGQGLYAYYGSAWNYLNATGGGSSFESYPACYTHSGSTNITNSAATVALDTETLDPASGHSISAGVITVSNAGEYHISYSVPVNDDGSTGGTRARVYCWVERNTGGGYSAITQSRGQDYAREASGGEGVSAAFIATLTAGDLIRLQIQQSGTTDVSTESGEAQLSLHRVRA